MVHIYTKFSDFINEEKDEKLEFKRAQEIIQSNQEKGSDFKLPDDYNAFPDVKIFNEDACMSPRLCYLNAFQVAKDNPDLHLAIGMVIDDEIPDNNMADVTPHAFNIDDRNKVHDYTLGFIEDEDDNYPDGYIYVGRTITDKEFELLENSNNVGSEIREILLKEIK